MAMLNLGILAHVDAGKTTLTERLLYAAGVIDEVGRVDSGTTQTDSLALERQRGITIKSAVVSFVVDGVTINLIDTPGHPDFIAEVERVLGVLDGAVLVVSAVEGVQSQTLVLFRALRRLRVPTVVFVNKIDRTGADDRRVLEAIEQRITANVLEMGRPWGTGTRDAGFVAHDLDDPMFAAAAAEALADHDDSILRSYLDGTPGSPHELHRAIAEQTAQLHLLPVFFGAALTGVGVDDLLHAIPTLLCAAASDTAGPGSGAVFKIERGASGEKVALVRMFSGTLRVRDRVRVGSDTSHLHTVTAIEVFDRGSTRPGSAAEAGEIAKVHGLSTAHIGDTFGPNAHPIVHVFAPPTLETAIAPRHPGQKRAVFDALADLAEQDPLINLRQDDSRQELFLSLYGEVQKEVVAQTLAQDYGLDIEFRPTTPVCVERPKRSGAAIELLRRGRSPAHPFLATVGLAIAPLPAGTGVTFDLDVSHKAIPTHVFDTVDAFRDLMQRTVHDTLRQGLFGWAVTDCQVVMTDCDYQAPPRKWPGTTLSDYRLLTPLVLMAALKQAGTTVHEPLLEFHMEFPAHDLGSILSLVSNLGAQPHLPETNGSTCALTGTIRVADFHQLQTRLPDLTRGEGMVESAFAGYRPIDGPPPSRPRTDRNPLDRADYLRRVNA
jgi:ribosomal protection tetracycline resistance protein